MNGGGKGWAKGRTAATDGRVARNAASHRGMTYTRHIPVELDRRMFDRRGEFMRRTLPLEWSPVMAYVVGLMATDGCLVNTGRHLAFGSEDRELVETLLSCLGRPLAHKPTSTPKGKPYFRAQFGDVGLYKWLESVGLTQRKSLTMGPLDVPDDVLMHCARGLLDGDGSVLNFWYDGSGNARGRRYENLVTVFNCASEAHLQWLRERLARSLSVRGALVAQPPSEYGTIMWRLAYAIRESSRLLPHIYPSLDVPRLHRKWSIWAAYASRHGLPATLAEITKVTETRGSYRAA